jgi:hypothetical protein
MRFDFVLNIFLYFVVLPWDFKKENFSKVNDKKYYGIVFSGKYF